jgi:hypothetical protein
MSREKQNKRVIGSNNLSRRSFLGKTAVAATAFTIIPRHVMGGQGKTAPSDLINVAGIGVGSQGGGDIQQICTPDVAIVRPQRNMNGTPMTKEQLAAQEARRAEMMKRMPQQGAPGQGAPPQGAPGQGGQRPGAAGRQADPNAPVQMGDAQGGRVIKLTIFMRYATSIKTMPVILLKVIQRQRSIPTGAKCLIRKIDRCSCN